MTKKDFNENFGVLYNAVNDMFEHLRLVDESIPNDMDITKLSIKSIGETLRAVMLNLSTVQNEVNKLYKDGELERACKNQAYCFILSSGNFDSFKEYDKKTPLSDFNKSWDKVVHKFEK